MSLELSVQCCYTSAISDFGVHRILGWDKLMKKRFVWIIACSSFLACLRCGNNAAVSEEAARSLCPQLSIIVFNDTVELARLARDSGNSQEDRNSAFGSLCVEFALDFSSCSQCIRSIGNLVWG